MIVVIARVAYRLPTVYPEVLLEDMLLEDGRDVMIGTGRTRGAARGSVG
jgi:hypothetical protein